MHYIRKSVVVNSLKSGRLDFLDVSTLNNTLKISWLTFGGLFSGMCDYKIEKLPVKPIYLSCSSLVGWKLIYKHKLLSTALFIWNNRCILYKHKSIF